MGNGHIRKTFLRNQKDKSFVSQGGVATGKSTVSNMLRELGIPVIDADAMARRWSMKPFEKTMQYFDNDVVV